ncbi:TauD/TfdA family dioxygenase [Streptomyces virginiae]|uniref:TauD/TfdA family dioxygenase n=1 Tax=Streptomyces virginiae TaxID=1961 RepID=UPI0035E30F08
MTTTSPPTEVAGAQPDATPLLLADAFSGAADWIAGHRDALSAALTEHGAVLVRGLGIRDPATVGTILHGLGATPVREREAFAPRQQYAEGVYSSSAWPPNQPMCMHHELSYTLGFPSLLLFACLTEPDDGGATALADSTAVLEALPPALSDRFTREGWILTRAYGNGIGPSVAEAFGSDDPEAVERYCRTNAIDCAWQPDGTLRTRQRRTAVLRHPTTGQRCWFNQIAFLNEWTIDSEIREYLIAEFGPEGLPFNTYHGDGAPMAEETVRTINAVYEAHTTRRPWQAGDLLIIDNVRTAHSREAFKGPREVIVAMGRPRHPQAPSQNAEVTLP